MKDTPGWASPGSAPSDGQEADSSGPADRPVSDRPAPSAGSPAAPPPPAPQSGGQPGGNPPDPGTKWSKEQPPRAQWSAPAGPRTPGQAPPPPPPPPPPGAGWGGPPPAGPGPYGGPPQGPVGYGGHPGWGAGWGGPPPAAKPGVIPLRPLGVGEILDGAVSTMRTYWRTVLGISLTVAIVTQLIVVLLEGLVLNSTTDTSALNDPSATLDEQTRAMGDLLLESGIVLLVTLVGTIIATALLTTVTSRAVLGRPVTLQDAWRDARPRIPRLFGLLFLLLLIAAAVSAAGALPGVLVSAAGAQDAGAALSLLGTLGAVLVTLWLLVRFSLASPALMLEKQGIKKALGRSAKLVRGSWWRTFGIQLLALIITNIVAAIVVVPFALAGAAASDSGVSGFLDGTGNHGWTYLIISGIGSVIGSMITLPIVAGVVVLLYIDQRIRREALDLDLARAAGLQGYDNRTPGATPGR
ncbi:glycerophosphoryl diester phosphodiesterase membrane domain-containing protein [Streptomyces sp. NPDC002588]|uniref:glycerophosphoryl diester phosphodiesterase membrane domain-containing protein n=1 Tax=Streptomyces sp. NPDC002588 TaxID=3154419 RepID=UPI0033174073